MGVKFLRILIADDHELFLYGLKLSLADLDKDAHIDLARDYRELMSFIYAGTNYNLIMTDLAMPGMTWIDALTEIRKKTKTPIVILSAVHNRDIIKKAIDLGASGFIPKTSSNRIIINALQMILSGKVYIPPDIYIQEETDINISSESAKESENKTLETNENNELDNLPLTGRQKDVLALIGQGKPNKIIADELQLSEGTVKLHVTAILKALGVNNRTEAVIVAKNLTPNKTKN